MNLRRVRNPKHTHPQKGAGYTKKKSLRGPGKSLSLSLSLSLSRSPLPFLFLFFFCLSLLLSPPLFSVYLSLPLSIYRPLVLLVTLFLFLSFVFLFFILLLSRSLSLSSFFSCPVLHRGCRHPRTFAVSPISAPACAVAARKGARQHELSEARRKPKARGGSRGSPVSEVTGRKKPPGPPAQSAQRVARAKREAWNSRVWKVVPKCAEGSPSEGCEAVRPRRARFMHRATELSHLRKAQLN